MSHNSPSQMQQVCSVSQQLIGLANHLQGSADGQSALSTPEQVFGFFHQGSQIFFYCQSKEEMEAMLEEIKKIENESEVNKGPEKEWLMFQDVFDDIRLSGPQPETTLHFYED